MKPFLVALTSLVFFGGYARAQQASPQAPVQVQPATPQPTEAPPAPPEQLPPPPDDQAQQAQQQPSAGGQWVYTQQYGWVWMPYGQQYTYAPDQNVDPYAYVYYPTYGWTWVMAPWIWGWGVLPYWGYWGPSHFWWYNHWWGGGGYGSWRNPRYGGAGRTTYAYPPGYRGGVHYGTNPYRGNVYRGNVAPNRGGFYASPYRGAARSAPMYRGNIGGGARSFGGGARSFGGGGFRGGGGGFHGGGGGVHGGGGGRR